MKNYLILLLSTLVIGCATPQSPEGYMSFTNDEIVPVSLSQTSFTSHSLSMNTYARPSNVFGLGGLANYFSYAFIYFAFGSSGALALLALAGWLACTIFAWVWGVRAWKQLNKAKWKKPKRKIWAKIGIVVGIALAMVPLALAGFVAAISEIGFVVFALLIGAGMWFVRRNRKVSA